MLKNKNVLIGVTGSIAIYKTLDLIRIFSKAGATVRVVMSEEAKRFVTPLTFEAISQNTVLHSGTESWANDNNHIDIGKWADIFIIAPATANTINKLSNGIADNLLLQIAIAYTEIKMIAPAANTNMYLHNTTQTSLKMLSLINYEIVDPQKKLLACKDEGVGAMAEPQEIFWQSARALLKEEFWENRKVVVTGGGTVEKIDDIRYISNFSSGKMANAVAKALYIKGAEVCLISSRDRGDIPLKVHFIDTQSADEMKEYLKDSIRVAKKGVLTKTTIMEDSAPKLIQKTPYLFMAAAISDYTPKFPQNGKLKKESLGESWNIECKKTVDILSSIDKNDIKTIGFKAETDKQNALINAKNMIENKNLDAVCLNVIDEDNGFGEDTNLIDFITKEKVTNIEKDEKLNVSLKVLDLAQKL